MSKLKAAETAPGHSYLASLDVKSLYRNIRNFEGKKYTSSILQGLSLTFLRFIDNNKKKGRIERQKWTERKEEFIRNLDELNTKHDANKSEHKISKNQYFFTRHRGVY